mgnify:CR=1 FL=1
MGKRIGTTQRKTRHKLQLHCREKGKISLSRYFQDYTDGDKVNLKLNANVQKGRFYSRFHGLSGTVVGKRGSCYTVRIKDGNKVKDLYVHPIHLTKQK